MRKEVAAAVLLLIIAVLGVYRQTFGFDFIAFDDPIYVYRNKRVIQGLTPENIKWAVTAASESTWQPLTWLSLMTDTEIGRRFFGYPNDKTLPGVFHASNVVMHTLSTLLLFFLMLRISRKTWPSAFTAALFALHPQHVESVVWVTERKDTLSAVFWMLSIHAYIAWANKRGAARYALVCVLFALGLTAKPMLVTLPAILLLMDFWPLKRMSISGGKYGFGSLVVEKLPLFALSAASTVVTCLAQRVGGALSSLNDYPIDIRFSNASVAAMKYLFKTFFPVDLVFFYPHPMNTIPEWQVVASAAAILAITFAAIAGYKKLPVLTFGWLWFAVTLLPVIGIVQTGDHAMADRFSYIPHIGIFAAVTWFIYDRLGKLKWGQAAMVVAGVMVVAVFGYMSWSYAAKWRDSKTLFSAALKSDPDNYIAHNNLGAILAENRQYEEAEKHFRATLEVMGRDIDAHANLGTILMDKGEYAEAAEHFRCVIPYLNRDVRLCYDMAITEAKVGNTDAAIRLFERVLELAPDFYKTHNNLAVSYFIKGDYERAWEHVRLCRRYGVPIPPAFLKDLEEKAPESRN